MKKRQNRKSRIKTKVKARLSKSALPRLSVFRSNKHIYVQAIDDTKKTTICAISDLKASNEQMSKTERAKLMGEKMGIELKKLKIARAVFDRRHYKYTGRVKALCEGIRQAGITI